MKIPSRSLHVESTVKGQSPPKPPHENRGVHYLSDAVITVGARSEEHTSELQSLMRISYAVFCLQKKLDTATNDQHQQHNSFYIYNLHNTYYHSFFIHYF